MRWLVRLLSLATDFGNPGVLCWWLLLEYVDSVVAHSLLSHNDLLGPIDDEVAPLIVAAVLAVLDALVLIQVLELAKIAAKHNWNFPEENSLLLFIGQLVLDFALALTCDRTVVKVIIELFLAELDVDVHLRIVSQVAKTGIVGEHGQCHIILLGVPRQGVD